MIVTTNIPGKRGRAPRRPTGTTLWASIDVEWTKNYRITNGDRPFAQATRTCSGGLFAESGGRRVASPVLYECVTVRSDPQPRQPLGTVR